MPFRLVTRRAHDCWSCDTVCAWAPNPLLRLLSPPCARPTCRSISRQGCTLLARRTSRRFEARRLQGFGHPVRGHPWVTHCLELGPQGHRRLLGSFRWPRYARDRGHGGSADKFVGDDVMGLFGCPISTAEAAAMPLAAAGRCRLKSRRGN